MKARSPHRKYIKTIHQCTRNVSTRIYRPSLQTAFHSPRPTLHFSSRPSVIRTLTTTTPKMTTPPIQKDWSATRYLQFANERTRPVYDLLARVSPHLTSLNPRIYDLGCGPGNSTSVILSHFPTAYVTGIDTSADMLAKARAAVPSAEFIAGDVAAFDLPEASADLVFSNATFQWLRSSSRIPTLARLFKGLKPGGVLAIQVPDNYDEASHASMRDTALMDDAPWAPFFADTRVGDLGDAQRPDLDPIETPAAFYEALAPGAQGVDVWRTTYMHVLGGSAAVVEWVKATGLQPYVNRIRDKRAKKAFLEEYEKKIVENYPTMVDGKVLLGYPRLFVVAVKN